MNQSIETPTQTKNRPAVVARPKTPHLRAGLALAPRFGGFQGSGRSNGPSRLTGALRAIATRGETRESLENGATDTSTSLPDVPGENRAAAPIPQSPRLQHAADDRRRFLRRQSTHLVRALPERDAVVDPDDLVWALHESPFRGQMSNISMNGVAFVLNQPMPLSGRVWLKLESRTREFSVIRSGRIVRVAPVSELEWIVTCRFDRCVPYADVVQLGQELG